MKVMVKDIKGKLISINPAKYTVMYGGYDVKMKYENYDVEFYNVEEKDITVIME